WTADPRWSSVTVANGDLKALRADILTDFKLTFPDEASGAGWDDYWENKIRNDRKTKFNTPAVTKKAINKLLDPAKSKKVTSARAAFGQQHKAAIKPLYDAAITAPEVDGKNSGVRSKVWNRTLTDYIAQNWEEFCKFKETYKPTGKTDAMDVDDPESASEARDDEGGASGAEETGRGEPPDVAQAEISETQRLL
ncbi:hypothetical protein AURDEDRAFT_173762, partial [Auricularia subglabra TFB-10046 SS5]